MKVVTKVVKKNINTLAVCVFETIVGILLLIDPVAFTSAVIVIAGLALMAAGLYSSVRYFREDPVKASSGQLLMMGLALLFAGSFCVFRSNWFIETLPIVTVIYGTVILIVGFCKVQTSIDLVRTKNKKWFLSAISAVLSVICSLIAFSNPFGEQKLDSLWVFTGWALIVLAVLDITSFILSKISEKENAPVPVSVSEEENEKNED